MTQSATPHHPAPQRSAARPGPARPGRGRGRGRGRDLPQGLFGVTGNGPCGRLSGPAVNHQPLAVIRKLPAMYVVCTVCTDCCPLLRVLRSWKVVSVTGRLPSLCPALCVPAPRDIVGGGGGRTGEGGISSGGDNVVGEFRWYRRSRDFFPGEIWGLWQRSVCVRQCTGTGFCKGDEIFSL